MDIRTGSISQVTGKLWASAVSGGIIDLSQTMNRGFKDGQLWCRITGDLGVTGSSMALRWDGCYTKSGASYSYRTGTSPEYIVKSGTSKTGPNSDGVYLKQVELLSPFIRLRAIADKADTTNTMQIDYAIMLI